MKRNCPNPNCFLPHILKNGFYFRKDDSRNILDAQVSVIPSFENLKR